MLADDPNNVPAFRALAELVRRHAASQAGDGDPLSAAPDSPDHKRAADLAVWALGEELAGNPRAWYPLVEVARLSLKDDHDGAMRRLGTAAERDPDGHALAEGIAMLRQVGKPGDALNLGVGHWHVREHSVDVGRELVRAALDAGRPAEARMHLDALNAHPDKAAVHQVQTELAPEVESAVGR